jgi:hypothetical protein
MKWLQPSVLAYFILKSASKHFMQLQINHVSGTVYPTSGHLKTNESNSFCTVNAR